MRLDRVGPVSQLAAPDGSRLRLFRRAQIGLLDFVADACTAATPVLDTREANPAGALIRRCLCTILPAVPAVLLLGADLAT